MAKDKNPLDGVVRFIPAEGFQEDLQALMLQHVTPALEATGVTLETLPATLDPQIYAILVTCVVEDLMTREGKDGRNVTDAYLKRHGWKQGSGVKRQLQALRESKARLYEITAVKPGIGLTLRDLLAPDISQDVSAPGLANALPVGCPLGVRILRVDGEAILSGGILPFEENMGAEATEAVRAAAGDDENLAPHITAFWLRKTLEEQAAEAASPTPAKAPVDDY
jgi:hypothetical protein